MNEIKTANGNDTGNRMIPLWTAEQEVWLEKIRQILWSFPDPAGMLIGLRLGLLDGFRRTAEESSTILNLSLEETNELYSKYLSTFKKRGGIELLEGFAHTFAHDDDSKSGGECI